MGITTAIPSRVRSVEPGVGSAYKVIMNMHCSTCFGCWSLLSVDRIFALYVVGLPSMVVSAFVV
jgi:hypothetical protein